MRILPMLAETGSVKDLNRKEWLYEQKLDGVRCVATLGAETELQSRTGKIITRKFPELAEIHKQVGKPCVLDGEIAGVDFNAVQHRIHVEDRFKIKIARTRYPVVYCIFDILSLDGESVEDQALIERKDILNSILTPSPEAKALEWADTGEALFDELIHQGLEGIMAKDRYARYVQGKRSYSWLKVKNFREGIFYVCGVTEGENDRSDTFGSLILGTLVSFGGLDGQDLPPEMVHVGNVGSGFTHSQLSGMLGVLKVMEDECPFKERVDTDRPVKFWTRPEMRVEVRYLYMPGRPEDGFVTKLRFPTFRRVVS